MLPKHITPSFIVNVYSLFCKSTKIGTMSCTFNNKLRHPIIWWDAPNSIIYSIIFTTQNFGWTQFLNLHKVYKGYPIFIAKVQEGPSIYHGVHNNIWTCPECGHCCICSWSSTSTRTRPASATSTTYLVSIFLGVPLGEPNEFKAFVNLVPGFAAISTYLSFSLSFTYPLLEFGLFAMATASALTSCKNH